MNDEFGHDIGDEVLKGIAAHLLNSIRGADICGRLGGEELVVFVSGVDSDVGMRVAERHREAVAALHESISAFPRQVTVSIGVAAYSPITPDGSIEDLLRRADGALYEAKRNGRNRVVLAAPIAAPIAVETLPEEVKPLTTPSASRQPPPRSTEDVELQLLRKLEAGRGSLPVLPQVAATALRLANDPDADMGQFAALVERDPHIAARFLSLANSAVYSRGHKTTTTRDAVVRVGLAGARDILFQIVYSASTVGLPRFQQAVAASYRRGVLSGLASRLICKVLGINYGFDYLCGLLHDLGEARVYRVLAQIELPCNERRAGELVGNHHGNAGAELASAWGLPEDLIEACSFHHAADPDPRFHVRLVQMSDAFLAYADPSSASRVIGTTKTWYERFGLTQVQGEAIHRSWSDNRKEINSRGW